MQQFALFKGDMPRLVTEEVALQHSIMAWKMMKIDAARCAYFQALQEWHKEKGQYAVPVLHCSISPMAVFAREDIDKGKVRCAPTVPLQFIMVAASAMGAHPTGHYVTINDERLQVFIAKPPMPTAKELNSAASKWPDTCAIQHFFWLRESVAKGEECANCEQKQESYMGMKIPVLINKCRVAKNDRLCIFQPPKVKAKSAVAQAWHHVMQSTRIYCSSHSSHIPSMLPFCLAGQSAHEEGQSLSRAQRTIRRGYPH